VHFSRREEEGRGAVCQSLYYNRHTGILLGGVGEELEWAEMKQGHRQMGRLWRRG